MPSHREHFRERQQGRHTRKAQLKEDGEILLFLPAVFCVLVCWCETGVLVAAHFFFRSSRCPGHLGEGDTGLEGASAGLSLLVLGFVMGGGRAHPSSCASPSLSIPPVSRKFSAIRAPHFLSIIFCTPGHAPHLDVMGLKMPKTFPVAQFFIFKPIFLHHNSPDLRLPA